MHHCPRRARLSFNLSSVKRFFPYVRCAPFSPRPKSSSNSSGTGSLIPRRTFASKSSTSDDLFNYTSGRWLVNEDLRFSERRHEFDVDGLCRLAAQSVGSTPQDVDTLVKLGEGGFNRTFLITFYDGFKMVARIPYPITGPKLYGITSEVATMRFLRSSGFPVPDVYDYSPSPDNAARTEYIFMEYVRGTKLSDLWSDLEETEIASILGELAQLEFHMMSIPFPAGGSLYYSSDLERLAGMKGIPLGDDEQFCVGPDVRLRMWLGRRSQLNVDRGPYKSPLAAIESSARKELAYLENFGRPLLPFRRERRESYEYKEQSPSDHVENLERCLRVAPLLVPELKPALLQFRIRHPDISPSNIIVSRSPDSEELKIVSLLDWQNTSILPLAFCAGVPDSLQNYDDPVSRDLMPPTLPDNMDELDENAQSSALGVQHKRLVHFHYVKSTLEYNKQHRLPDALSDPVCILLFRLFHQASTQWEAETHDLKNTLIEITQMWERIMGEGVPCPISFDPEDLRKTKELAEKVQLADENAKMCQVGFGFGSDTWMPKERYDEVKANTDSMKRQVLMLIAQNEDEEIRANLTKVEANWFLDDMDETNYL